MLLRFTHSARLATISLAFAGLAATAVLWQPATVSAAGPAPSSVEFYQKNVQPIFQANCYRCHGGTNHRGGLQLDTQASILHGGKDGSVITPGHPEQSLLVALIRHEGPTDDPKPMPPKGKLSDADVATITAWIKAGAVMPKD